MERNHTLTVIEKVFELFLTGSCKTIILFHSYTFHLGVTENLLITMMMMMMMMTVRIIKALIIIIISCIKSLFLYDINN